MRIFALSSVLKPGIDFSDVLAVASAPGVFGVSIRVAWSHLEPEPGELNPEALAAVEGVLREVPAGRVMLRLHAGANSPSWILDTLPTERGHFGPEPVPWEPDYLDAWARLLEGVGRRFRGLAMVHTALSGRGSEWQAPSALRWHPDASERILGAYAAIAPAYRSARISRRISWNMSRVWPGTTDHHAIADALHGAGERFFQLNILRDDTNVGEDPWSKLISLRASGAICGAQMGFRKVSKERHDRALEIATGVGCDQWIEVYPEDVPNL